MSELDEDVFEVLEALGIEDARLSDARVLLFICCVAAVIYFVLSKKP